MDVHPDPSWLHAIVEDDVRFIDTHRLRAIASELPRPADQRPLVVHFIGDSAKRRAFEYLYPNISIPAETSGGLVSLHLDESTFDDDTPILVAECNPDKKWFPAEGHIRARNSIDSRTYATGWLRSCSNRDVAVTVLGGLFHLFADVICVFADDFATLATALDFVDSYAAAASSSPLRPRLIVIQQSPDLGQSPTDDLIQLVTLRDSLDERYPNTVFAACGFVILGEDMYPLQFEIADNVVSARRDRSSESLLFSATHLCDLFERAVTWFADGMLTGFDFVAASRSSNPVDPARAKHMARLMRITRATTPFTTVAKFAASTLLVDMYNPHMHAFQPGCVFNTLYRAVCKAAILEAYGSSAASDGYESMIRWELCKQHEAMRRSKHTSLQVFKRVVQESDINWSFIRSNTTCLACLARPPENVLSCGHALCDTCVRNFGTATKAIHGQFCIPKCVLCKRGKLLVGLLPHTAGLRVLTLDGGAVRGMITAAILESMQTILGTTWRVQDLFDHATGTSVGGLIVLWLFVKQIRIEDCGAEFRRLAGQLFPQRANPSSFARLFKLAHAFMRDGYYDVRALEKCLKHTFTASEPLFGHRPALIATKVSVVAATIDHGTATLLPNYNGPSLVDSDCGYQLVRTDKSEVRVWEAGRITSAAPSLFPHASSDASGALQDGAMSGHNNPVKLALQECMRTRPSLPWPDVLVSIGTGSRPDMYPLKPNTFRSIGRDGFMQRCLRAWYGSFDGDITFQEARGSLPPTQRHRLIRLNVTLPSDDATITNTAQLPEMEYLVNNDKALQRSIRITAQSLLVKSFFFELDSLPSIRGNQWYCVGRIRSRIPGSAHLGLLERVGATGFTFSIPGSRTISVDQSHVCRACGQFTTRLHFAVSSLENELYITAKDDNYSATAIGAMPNTINWFLRQQGLCNIFGSDIHATQAPCLECISAHGQSSRKRRRTDSD